MAYVQAKEEDIEIVKSPVGMPGRGNTQQADGQSGVRRSCPCDKMPELHSYL